MFSVYDVFLCASKLTPFFLYNSGFFSMCFKAYFFVILWASILIPLLLHVVMVDFFFYMHCDISKHVSYKLLHTSHFRVTFCDIYSIAFFFIHANFLFLGIQLGFTLI